MPYFRNFWLKSISRPCLRRRGNNSFFSALLFWSSQSGSFKGFPKEPGKKSQDSNKNPPPPPPQEKQKIPPPPIIVRTITLPKNNPPPSLGGRRGWREPGAPPMAGPAIASAREAKESRSLRVPGVFFSFFFSLLGWLGTQFLSLAGLVSKSHPQVELLADLGTGQNARVPGL